MEALVEYIVCGAFLVSFGASALTFVACIAHYFKSPSMLGWSLPVFTSCVAVLISTFLLMLFLERQMGKVTAWWDDLEWRRDQPPPMSVPSHVVMLRARLQYGMPDAEFSIRKLHVSQGECFDPFLVIRLAGRKECVEVWDELYFESKA
jgi:hypothetical protein